MPLKRCTNAEGKKGWSWGSGGCQVAGSDKESKKQAIRVGLKVEGPEKFSKIMKHEGSKAFYDVDGLETAKAIYNEIICPTKSDNKYLSAVASYFASKADPGDMDSDTDKSGILGSTTNTDNVVKPAGDLEDSDTKDPSGGLENMPGQASEDNYGKDGKNDNDGDEPDPVAKGDLDTKVENIGSHTVVPPYNKEAAPENKPGEYDEPRQTPPTREESTPKEVSKSDDKRFGMDDDTANAAVSAIAETYGFSFAELSYLLENKCYAYVSQKTRDNMDSSSFGWPEEKKYPVANEAHFRAAVKLLGRAPADKQEMIKRNLIRIAKQRGYSLPESWKSAQADTEFEETAVNKPSEGTPP